jgi:hypothetical protein
MIEKERYIDGAGAVADDVKAHDLHLCGRRNRCLLSDFASAAQGEFLLLLLFAA